MKKGNHSTNPRGKANLGWLNADYSFSFVNYFNPNLVQYGLLRVLNHDIITPGLGFETHWHDKDEIYEQFLCGINMPRSRYKGR